MSENKTLVPLEKIYADPNSEINRDSLNYYLGQNPPETWIKVHPYIKNYRYLPIDKTEWLLRKFFKKYRIEILREGTAFNGVYVTVRVWYKDPVTGDMDFHDGIGAAQLQTKSGSSPADLGNINQGALSMAFPIAKTVAVKDACDHFGNLFGANLNRKDVVPVVMDDKLAQEADLRKQAEINRLKALIDTCIKIEVLEKLEEHVALQNNDNLTILFNQKHKELCNQEG